MPPTTTPYLLTEVIQETPDTKTYRIRPQAGGEVIQYKAGQFVQLHLTPDAGVKESRSYSIASSPTVRDWLDLTIKIQGSFPQLLKDLQPGHVFGLRGPLGHFHLVPEAMPHAVLLGAGVGVTPMMGMLRWAAAVKLPNKITFIDVNKTESDTIYREELLQAGAANPNLDVVLSYTRLAPEHPWKGERGRLDWGMIERHVPEPLAKHYFICGPDQMNKDLKALLIEKGVPREQVKLENMGM